MAKHDVAKIIELVGSSEKGWSEAADAAVKQASKSIKNITGRRYVSARLNASIVRSNASCGDWGLSAISS